MPKLEGFKSRPSEQLYLGSDQTVLIYRDCDNKVTVMLNVSLVPKLLYLNVRLISTMR